MKYLFILCVLITGCYDKSLNRLSEENSRKLKELTEQIHKNDIALKKIDKEADCLAGALITLHALNKIGKLNSAERATILNKCYEMAQHD